MRYIAREVFASCHELISLHLSYEPLDEHRSIESFNSRVRDEFLTINIFWSLAQARVVITGCKEDHRRRRLSPGLPSPSPLRCRLHAPMNDPSLRVDQFSGSGQRSSVPPSSGSSAISPPICRGPEIAGELSASVNTVNTHVRSIYSKLQTGDRSSAMHRAQGLRLLSPGTR
jgi:hypothetical protein